MDRRNEVLNEAIAREVERNVRTREEIGHARRKVTAQEDLRESPTPPDPDPRKIPEMKAATVDEKGGRRRPCSCRIATEFEG